MKQILLVLFALCISLSAGAQLKADAGPNQTWCINFNVSTNGPKLGGAVVADQGTPPYTYSWRTLYSTFPAQSFLDSVTSDHPALIAKSPRVDSLYFELEVTDANAQKAYDTVRVYFSRWVCPLVENVISKGAADTVNLRVIECRSAFPPNTFLYWTTSSNLADSTLSTTKCWVPYSKQYTGLYMNQLGCIDSANCYIDVAPAAVSTITLAANTLAIYPNPLQAESRILCGAAWVGGSVSILSADGKLLATVLLKEGETALNFNYPAGIYLYQAVSPNGLKQNGKLIKE